MMRLDFRFLANFKVVYVKTIFSLLFMTDKILFRIIFIRIRKIEIFMHIFEN